MSAFERCCRVAVFDGLHKYSKWKTLLKGFFDSYGDRVRAVVTGSSRPDVFRRGGDSLMGRYLLYRLHPWSVAECVRPILPDREHHPPAEIPPPDWDALWEHGGFELRYLRDRQKREVDFLIVRDRKPWFLAEAKLSDTRLSPALAHFQAQVGAPHAFQVVLTLPFEAADPFTLGRPVVVPGRTLLSQLL